MVLGERAASTRAVKHGLRLLDYMRAPRNRAKIAHLPPPHHSQHLVFAQQQEPTIVERNLELATVIGAEYKVYDRHGHGLRSYKHLKSLLNHLNACDLDAEHQPYTSWINGHGAPEASFVGRFLTGSPYKADDLRAWISAFQAETLAESLQAMEGREWPAFLLLFTLNRRARTKREAYDAITLYERMLPSLKTGDQLMATWYSLQLALTTVIEMVPAILRVFVKYATPEARSTPNFNEILWNTAKFGTSWSAEDAAVLLAGQQVVVNAMGTENLDTKGLVGIAYPLVFRDPELALRLVASRLPDPAGTFPYRYGPWAIKLLTSTSTAESLNIFHSMGPENQAPRMWSILLLGLRNNGIMTSELATRIWTYWKSNTVTINPTMVRRVVASLRSLAEKTRVLNEAKRLGIEIEDPSSVLLTDLEDSQDYFEALELIEPLETRTNKTQLALLRAQAKFDKPAAWDTYTALVSNGHQPTAEALTALCQAAFSSTVKWGEFHAAQRATHEVRLHVRGQRTGSDADDVFTIYPTSELVYAYVYMLGVSGYTDELLDVLAWLEHIKFRPNKRILSALIHFSPNGAALLKLGPKVSSDWPTKDEYELYKHELQAAGRGP